MISIERIIMYMRGDEVVQTRLFAPELEFPPMFWSNVTHPQDELNHTSNTLKKTGRDLVKSLFLSSLLLIRITLEVEFYQSFSLQKRQLRIRHMTVVRQRPRRGWSTFTSSASAQSDHHILLSHNNSKSRSTCLPVTCERPC
jgi:hypothetical protein